MLIQWMSYATLIGALIAAAAFAVEAIAAMWGRSRRWVWVVALVVAAVTPLVLASRRAAASATPVFELQNTNTLSEVAVTPVVTRTAAPAPSLKIRASALVHSLDRYFVGGWSVASIALLMLLVRAATTLQRRRRDWTEIELDGERVLIADDVGPAVIGTIRPRIVIPDWALALDGTARQLMLRHEREHIRARDPQLVLLSLVSLALFPWNAALWMIVRRLRLTIEMDCDGRVLRAANRPREYGMLLLTVGARQSAPFHLAASLAERRPLLERRIRAMTTLRPAYPKLATTLLVVIAVGATTAATRAPHPAPLVPARAVVAPRQTIQRAAPIAQVPIANTSTREVLVPTARTEVPAPTTLKEVSVPTSRVAFGVRADSALTTAEIRDLIERFYPSVLSGDESLGTITFVVDANRKYVMSQTGGRLDEARRLKEVAVAEMTMGGGRGGRGGNAGLAEVPVGGMPVKSEQMRIDIDSMKLVAIKKMLEARELKIDYAPGPPNDGDAVALKKLVEATVRGRSGGGAASDDSAAVLTALFKFRAAEAQVDKSQLIPTAVDPANVGLIQTMKIGPGGWAPAGISVVVVHLKP